MTPQAYVDEIVANTKELWKLMDIEYDDFIRTTEERHVKIVQKIFRQFYDQGDIYKSEYEGLYCTPCESFWTPTQLVEKDGVQVLPRTAAAPCQPMKEESYFFRMSKYQDWMIDYIESHPDFIQPAKPRQRDDQQLPEARPAGPVRQPHQRQVGRAGGL